MGHGNNADVSIIVIGASLNKMHNIKLKGFFRFQRKEFSDLNFKIGWRLLPDLFPLFSPGDELLKGSRYDKYLNICICILFVFVFVFVSNWKWLKAGARGRTNRKSELAEAGNGKKQ